MLAQFRPLINRYAKPYLVLVCLLWLAMFLLDGIQWFWVITFIFSDAKRVSHPRYPDYFDGSYQQAVGAHPIWLTLLWCVLDQSFYCLWHLARIWQLISLG